MAASPIGRLMRNSHRQPFSSPATPMIRPPRTGPSADAVETVNPKTPKARARSGPRNSCWTSPEFCGVSRPAVAPWTSRATTTSGAVGASPTAAEESTKPASPISIIRRRP